MSPNVIQCWSFQTDIWCCQSTYRFHIMSLSNLILCFTINQNASMCSLLRENFWNFSQFHLHIALNLLLYLQTWYSLDSKLRWNEDAANILSCLYFAKQQVWLAKNICQLTHTEAYLNLQFFGIKFADLVTFWFHYFALYSELNLS